MFQGRFAPDHVEIDFVHPNKELMDFSDDQRVLRLRGVQVATVLASSSRYPTYGKYCEICARDIPVEEHQQHTWEALGHWLAECENSGFPPTSTTFYDALTDLMCSPKHIGFLEPPIRDRFRRCLPDLCFGRGIKAELGDLHGQLRQYLDIRHLFLTDGGDMGVALLAEGVERGDLIVRFDVLPNYCFALKPTAKVSTDTPHYEFMGWVQFATDSIKSYEDGKHELFATV